MSEESPVKNIQLKVLLVDDDKNIRQMLKVSLRQMGCDAEIAESAEDAKKILQTQDFDLLITDFKMTGASGVDLVKYAKRLAIAPIAVVMTAFASFENAVLAIQEGAFDYLPKPFTNIQLGHLLSKVRTIVSLRRENERLRKGGQRADFFTGMTSPAITRLQEFVGRVAPTDATVLLVGESGTGKSELARVIHARSNRSAQTLVTVNCATLTESLLESELFGHAKGAFTGATHDHVGKLELAHNGTVFIDEIGSLSLSAQTRLLRFLQEKIVERVGSNKPVVVNARVIVATNQNLEEAVKEGTFREDLYFRINVFECSLVPLRFRREDLPVLIQKFLAEISAIQSAREIKKLSDTVMKVMLNYSWHGNIRELRNTIERLVVLASDREAMIEDLPDALKRPASQIQSFEDPNQMKKLEQIEREHIERVLSQEPNQERAAQILGITTVTLWRKRKQFGLP